MKEVLSKEQSWRKLFYVVIKDTSVVDNPHTINTFKMIHDEAWDQAMYTSNNAPR